jgi:uncharacterized iron-regulated membrane protein
MPPNTPEQRIRSSRLYALFWRWHFLTGFFAVPVLVIASLTGAILVYQDELHPLVYPGLDRVPPNAVELPLDQQIAVVLNAYPDFKVHGLVVYPQDSGRSTIIAYTLPNYHHDFFNPWNMGNAYVNPYNGKILGLMEASEDIFEWITILHKSFFLKLPGELLVDLATSWGIISLLAGLYLWWPRRKEKVWGVWLPRLKGGFRLIFRDLHTVPSVYITPFAIVVMLSGVLLGLSAGPILLSEILIGQFPTQLLSQKSTGQPGVQPISLDDVMSKVGPQPGVGPYSIGVPASSDGAYLIQYGSHTDAINYRVAMIDQYSGKFIVDYTAQTWPAGSRFYYLYIFNEVLHRGAYWGGAGKALTLIACLLVAFMSVTSWLMWWKRKPAGSWGIPTAVKDITFPQWVKGVFIVLSTILMPLVGLTYLVFLLGRWIVETVRTLFNHVSEKKGAI